MFRENSKFSVGFEENLEIVYQDDAKLSVTLHILSKKKKIEKKRRKRKKETGEIHRIFATTFSNLHLYRALLNRRLLESPPPLSFNLTKT